MRADRTRRLGIGLMTASIAVAAVVGSASVATAQPRGESTATCTWVGGREKIKVTVTGNPGTYTLVTVTDPATVLGTVEVDADRTGSTVLPMAPVGGYGVTAVENSLGANGLAPGCDKPIQVAAADVQLDLLDRVLSAVGSSALATDPTAR